MPYQPRFKLIFSTEKSLWLRRLTRKGEKSFLHFFSCYIFAGYNARIASAVARMEL